jgi:hypothetical protein
MHVANAKMSVSDLSEDAAISRTTEEAVRLPQKSVFN